MPSNKRRVNQSQQYPVLDRQIRPKNFAQLRHMYEQFETIIDLFDENSLREISGGYQNDIDNLIDIIEEETIKIFDEIPEPVSQDKFYNLTHVTESIHESLKVLNYNYFKTTMLPEFYMAPHSIEWGNIIQIYDRTCILASRGLGKSYEFSLALPIWKMYGYRKATDLNPISLDIARRREGLIITNKYELGRKLLSKISAEIKENNQLWERLKPKHKDEGTLGRERIETRNGCEINLRSAESSARGLHPDWIVVDDFADTNWIYSQTQRDKAIEHFYGDIMKTIERGGTINVVGTPFHEKDLYAHIREKDKTFKYFEYPAIFPDGTITAPHRWNMKELQQEYDTNGSLIFSREILVVPISDSSTIFPWSILEKAFVNMHGYNLVQNRDSFPIKFKRVVVGCDFAISASVGADSTVFAVWGLDDYSNYWLLYIWRKQGASHNEQIAKLKEVERQFRPEEIIAENNGFQRIMLDLAKEHGIKNVTEFTTTSWNKKDMYNGLPSLAVLFEQGRIRMPRGDIYSKEMSDWLCSEFNSITIKPDSGKLESAGQHDDGPMATFFSIKGVDINKNKGLDFIIM
jgi:hypothetical protein